MGDVSLQDVPLIIIGTLVGIIILIIGSPLWLYLKWRDSGSKLLHTKETDQ